MKSHNEHILGKLCDNFFEEGPYRLLYESQPTPTLLCCGNVVKVATESFVELFGFNDSKGIIDAPLEEILVCEKDGSIVGNVIQELSNSNKSKDFLICYKKNDGELIHAEIKISNIEIEGIELFQVSINDITKQKHTEEQLKTNIDIMEKTEGLAKFGNWYWDMRKNEFVCSEVACEIHGIDKRKFKPTYDNWVAMLHPDDKERVLKQISKLFDGEDHVEFEYRIHRADGAVRLLISWMSIDVDANGKPAKIAGATLDITKQRKTEMNCEVLNSVSSMKRLDLDLMSYGKELYKLVQKVKPIPNLYMSSYNNDLNELTIFFEAIDFEVTVEPVKPRKFGKGLSEHIITSNKSIQLNGEELAKFQEDNGLIVYGDHAKSWIGVPIRFKGQAIGAIAVQHLEEEDYFDDEDFGLLVKLGEEAGSFIEKYYSELEIKQFEKFFSVSMDLLCIAGTDGYLKKINPKFSEVLGYTESELLSRPFIDFIHEDDVEATNLEVVKLSKGELTVNFINRFRKKDGSYIWLMWGASSDEDQIYAAAKDITDQMKSQNVLSAMSEVLDHFISEEGVDGLFDKMLEVLLDVTQSEYGFIGEVLNDEEQPYLKTRAITNISWSKETAEFYEKNAPKGLEFKNLKTLFGKVITDQEPIISNDPYNDPKRGGLPPGHPRMNCFLGLPFFNGNEMIGMVGIANKPSGYTEDDIKLLAPILSTCSTLTTAMRNEVKKARAEQSAKKFSEIVAHSSDAIISTDNNGIVVSWNLGAESLLGYSADEMLGTPIYKIGPRLLKKEHDEVLETVKKGESIESYETLQLSKNGELMHVNMAIFPMKDREGKVTGISSILRDISVQKEAEKIKDEFTKSLEKEVKERTTDLEETQKELMLSLKKEQELGELKSRFVSIASHQFRTPLAIIAANFGLLDMLGENSDAEFNEKFKKIYSRVGDQIQNMTRLMDQALILGKINANSIKLELSSVNMVEACEDIIGDINEIQQDGRSTDFTVIGKNENVWTDLRLLDQAVSNILSNAFKYSSGKKNPEFELHLASEFFRIRVKDFGIGIPEDEMDKLFDPFFRASNVREISGTGLGTAIAKEYIELIGGEVSVISKEGQGTEFTITFLRIDL